MTTRRVDNRRDILLLLLYSPGVTDEPNEPVVGRTRLVKMLFLFKKEALAHFRAGTGVTEENFYEFFPWRFGPFSRQVYDDLTFFELRGFIKPQDADEDALPESAAEWQDWLACTDAVEPEQAIADYSEQEFRLTPRGQRFAADLFVSLSANQKALLREFKRRLSQVPLRALLKYVYENYPEQTDRSEIRESLLGAL